MTLRASNQVLCNVWSYDFYDMTLSIEWQQRHMIIQNLVLASNREKRVLNTTCFASELLSVKFVFTEKENLPYNMQKHYQKLKQQRYSIISIYACEVAGGSALITDFYEIFNNMNKKSETASFLT